MTLRIFVLCSLLAPSAFAQSLDSAAAARGRRDYERYCVWCHGERGDGRGKSARHFDTLPRDFTAAAFKCRTTASGALPADEDLRRAIQKGVHGTGMPSWTVLSALQLDDLVQTLKAFSTRWQSESAPAPIAVPPEPPDGSESIARGQAVYARMQCATCHGESGHGDGPALASLRDDQGNPIRAADFTRPGALRCGDEPARVYTTFMTGMNGTPMPSFAQVITPAEAWDLVHFVRSLR